MVRIPITITITCNSQNSAKQIHTPFAKVFHAGTSAITIALIASPPIQVLIPNQPHATSARRTAGTFAPVTPNDARANTGKGIPYFAPACALSSIGTRTSTFPRNTVKMACFQSIPPAIMPLASKYVGMLTLIAIHSAA